MKKSIGPAVILALGAGLATEALAQEGAPDPAIVEEVAAPEAGVEEGAAVPSEPVAEEDEALLPADGLPGRFPLLEGWDGSITFGLSGSQGNTETLTFRIDADARRESEAAETRLTLKYRYGQDDGEESENRFEATARNDWKFEDSRWRFFVEGTYLYDEYQVWRNAATIFAGPGYEIVSNDRTQIIGRVGAGGRYEDEGPGEGFKPEGLVGIDLEHKLTERQRIRAASTYFPSFDEFGEFRWENEVNWEIVVDPEVNLLLKVGVQHRHDSSPGEGFEPNDVDFFATLGWTF